MIIGFVGFIGSGKDTAADYLVNFHNFRRDSFASTLKDSVSAVFGWDRILLEGRTAESREWREQVDTWWAERLGMPNLTPRWVLQYWGTDLCRQTFHTDIWIASLENKLRKSKDNSVITDVRFPNEIEAIHNAGGKVVRIKRGPDPDWYRDAADVNAGGKCSNYAIAKERLEKRGVHASETAWVGGNIDQIINNDGTIDELFAQLKSLAQPNTTQETLPFNVAVSLDLI